MKSRSPFKVALLLVLLSVLAWHFGQPWLRAARLGAASWFVSPPRPSVIFIVLDNVRADRLSLCGHARPTSPTLDALAASGATYSCDATAPGSWTLPSHASYFTGKDPASHGAHYVLGPAAPARPLGEEEETLAERFAARGRQTLCISANPVVGPETNTTQGCQRQLTAEFFGDLYDDAMVEALEEQLIGLDPDTPLFLFLNIADAHRPWSAVPESLGWIPPRPPLNQDPAKDEARAYLAGELPAEQVEPYLARLDDVYTYGVHRADRTLGRALDTLTRSGWLDADSRLVIVSDHGEHLGEHTLLGHGSHLYEEDVRVPVLLRGPDAPSALPSPMSAMDLFQYVDAGEITAPYPVKTATWPKDAPGVPPGPGDQTHAALRVGAIKWIWTEGEVTRYDLAADPGELRGEPAAPSPELEAWAREVMASSGSEDEVMDPETLEALRAAGYID